MFYSSFSQKHLMIVIKFCDFLSQGTLFSEFFCDHMFLNFARNLVSSVSCNKVGCKHLLDSMTLELTNLMNDGGVSPSDRKSSQAIRSITQGVCFINIQPPSLRIPHHFVVILEFPMVFLVNLREAPRATEQPSNLHHPPPFVFRCCASYAIVW